MLASRAMQNGRSGVGSFSVSPAWTRKLENISMEESVARILTALPEHPAPEPIQRHEIVIDGLVGRPQRLAQHEVEALPPAEITADFACLAGWCVPGLHWEGVSLKTLLHHAYADPTADWVQVSAGAFSTCLSREQFETALIALRVGGEPLTHVHGGPFRLVVPGADCYTSVKWVSYIEVRETPSFNAACRIALSRIDQ